MQEMVTIFIEKWGYFGVFFLIALENIFPPIPSEVILTFTGFFTTCSNLNFVLALIFSVLGSVFGAIVLYIFGTAFSKKRIGKILKIQPQNIDKAYEWFNKKGNSTVFFCRFIPIVRSLISIPAGISKMRFTKFIIYTFFGTFIWNFILIYIGKITGDNWENISSVISKFSDYILVIIVVILFFLVMIKNKKINKKIKN